MSGIGTTYFGAVKRVENTDVRTHFMHVAFFPLDPMYSAYYVPETRTEETVVPGLISETKVLEFRLARRDWASMFLAWIRWIVVYSCVSLGGAIYIATWGLYEPARPAIRWGLWIAILFTIGLFGLTFLAFRKEKPERRKMRQISHRLFGFAIDPKYVDDQAKQELREFLGQPQYVSPDHDLFRRRLEQDPKEKTPAPFLKELDAIYQGMQLG